MTGVAFEQRNFLESYPQVIHNPRKLSTAYTSVIHRLIHNNRSLPVWQLSNSFLDFSKEDSRRNQLDSTSFRVRQLVDSIHIRIRHCILRLTPYKYSGIYTTGHDRSSIICINRSRPVRVRHCILTTGHYRLPSGTVTGHYRYARSNIKSGHYRFGRYRSDCKGLLESV